MRNSRKSLVLIAAAAVFGCGLGGPLQAVDGSGSPLRQPAGPRGTFLEKCSHCHEPERGYAIIDDYPAWVLTVARMSIKDRHWISPEELKWIIAYSSTYSKDRQALFGEHCGECHTWEELRSLGKSATQWRTWIRFMARRHGTELSAEECELLLCGLTGQV